VYVLLNPKKQNKKSDYGRSFNQIVSFWVWLIFLRQYLSITLRPTSGKNIKEEEKLGFGDGKQLEY
jgi:hypothetical protein